MRLFNALCTLGNLKWSHALVVVDYTIVFSGTFEEHLCKLDKVLERLENIEWTINLAKREFVFQNLKFLGHVLDKNGIQTDPKKVAAIV